MRGCLRKILRKLTGGCYSRILVFILSSMFWVWTVSIIAEWRWGYGQENSFTIVEKIHQTQSTSIMKNVGDKENYVKEKPVGMDDIMAERTSVMKNACLKHGLHIQGSDALHKINPWEYFINLKHSLVWCNVFKSASTSWMYIFNVLAGYKPKFLKKTKKVPLMLARAKYPRPSKELLKEVLSLTNVTSLIIGRNPFERLVSAYKDKIYGALPGTFHDKMRRTITHKYRNINVPKGKKLPVGFIPTFKEFVRYIVDENFKQNTPEMHWAPVYSFCNPCQVNFNSIAKFETLSEDTEFILKKIKATDIDIEKKNSAKDGKSSHEVTRTYLKELTKNLYKQLVDVYRIDFDLFGYQIPEYDKL